jgi:hypothetical protein
MYLFVHECTSHRPELFQWTVFGDSIVRLQNRRLYGLRPGRFSIKVTALGHSDSLAGEILAPVSLELSVYDTMLHVGDELVVGSRLTLAGGGRPRIDEVHFYNGTGGNGLSEEPLRWAYPRATRLLAQGLGVTCLGLSGYSKITWLKVAVVDSAGLTRSDGKPVDPRLDWFNCQKTSLYHPVAQPTERAPPPQPALADSDIAAGVKKALAFELCTAREQVKGDTGGMYDLPPALDHCADQVQAIVPDWTVDNGSRSQHGGGTYTISFVHLLAGNGGEKRRLVLDQSQGTLMMQEYREGPPSAYGMDAMLEGGENPAILSAVACARLHRARTGRPAPTIDSLLTFARNVWMESTPGDRPSHRCQADALRFRPRRKGEAQDLRVHESEVFVLRYSPHPKSVTLITRPVRWGETGVVSYRSEESGARFRTYENRDPRPGDEFIHPDRGYWVLPRSSSAK